MNVATPMERHTVRCRRRFLFAERLPDVRRSESPYRRRGIVSSVLCCACALLMSPLSAVFGQAQSPAAVGSGEPASEPVSVALLVDHSLSMRFPGIGGARRLAEAQRFVAALLDELAAIRSPAGTPAYRVALVSVGDEDDIRLRVSFEQDPSAIASRVSGLRLGGTTPLTRAIALTGAYLERTAGGPSALIVVSDLIETGEHRHALEPPSSLAQESIELILVDLAGTHAPLATAGLPIVPPRPIDRTVSRLEVIRLAATTAAVSGVAAQAALAPAGVGILVVLLLLAVAASASVARKIVRYRAERALPVEPTLEQTLTVRIRSPPGTEEERVVHGSPCVFGASEAKLATADAEARVHLARPGGDSRLRQSTFSVTAAPPESRERALLTASRSVLVNGVASRSRRLKAGDTITYGSYRIAFVRQWARFVRPEVPAPRLVPEVLVTTVTLLAIVVQLFVGVGAEDRIGSAEAAAAAPIAAPETRDPVAVLSAADEDEFMARAHELGGSRGSAISGAPLPVTPPDSRADAGGVQRPDAPSVAGTPPATGALTQTPALGAPGSRESARGARITSARGQGEEVDTQRPGAERPAGNMVATTAAVAGVRPVSPTAPPPLLTEVLVGMGVAPASLLQEAVPATPTYLPVTRVSPGQSAAVEPVDLLFIHAHPDDESIDFGVLLARSRAAGLRTALITLTDGESGIDQHPNRLVDDTYPDYDASGEELARLRVDELAAAATHFGVGTLVRLGLRNHPYGTITQVLSTEAVIDAWGGNDRVVALIYDWIERFSPSVVISPDGPTDAFEHFEHEATGIIVAEAVRRWNETGAGIAHYASVDPLQTDPVPERIESIAAWEPVDSSGEPARVRQLHALRSHRTQHDATVLAVENLTVFEHELYRPVVALEAPLETLLSMGAVAPVDDPSATDS